MEIPSLQRQIKAAQLPLETLAGNQKISQKEKLAEVSRQFEAILLRQVLSAAQKPAFPSKLNPPSVASDVYHDLITNQLADRISQAGTVGLARDLEKQLQHQLGASETVPDAEPPKGAGECQCHIRSQSQSYDRKAK
jgi:flagellar protein FlgJ